MAIHSTPAATQRLHLGVPRSHYNLSCVSDMLVHYSKDSTCLLLQSVTSRTCWCRLMTLRSPIRVHCASHHDTSASLDERILAYEVRTMLRSRDGENGF